MSAVERDSEVSSTNELAQLRSQTIWQTLSRVTLRNPRRNALVAASDAGEVQRLSYGRLCERVSNMSAGLASIGVRRGDRVVLWMTNSLEWVMNKSLLNPSAFGGRKVIDTDTHLTEPHDLWTKRAPARFKDRVPQVKVHDGVRSWIVDGDKILLQGAIPASTVKRDGTRWPGLEFINHQFEEVHPASHSARERVQLMDAAGISAQVLYPNILGFGGQNAVKVDDELRLACVDIFNDAMAEFQAESGQRIFPMALMPWWDVKLAVKEIERARVLGRRAHPRSRAGRGSLPA
jgi:hypothetical protein